MDTINRDPYPVKHPKVALIQQHWKEEPEDNLSNLLRIIDDTCSAQPIDLICMPEFIMGPPWYFPGKDHLKGLVDDTVPGRITDVFAQKAKKYGTYIVCGSILERVGDKFYNTSVVFDDNGALVAKCRKIHRYSAELVHLEPGDEQTIIDTPFGKLGICICADFWIQEMPRMMALKGAEIICVPGASLVKNINITKPCVQANSSHNVCYTLYTSLVGKVTGKRNGRNVTIEMGGHSTIASPDNIVAELNDEEDVLIAELDMDYIRESRTVDLSFKRSLYWCLWGRNPERFTDITKPYCEANQQLAEILADYLG